MKYINIPIFIISFAIGIFFVYIVEPDNRVVYVYPTPEMVDVLQYKDRAGTCFQFKPSLVECPKDESMISVVPPQ